MYTEFEMLNSDSNQYIKAAIDLIKLCDKHNKIALI